MSAVPNDLEPQDAAFGAPANVVEEAMSWQYGLGRDSVAAPVADVPVLP